MKPCPGWSFRKKCFSGCCWLKPICCSSSGPSWTAASRPGRESEYKGARYLRSIPGFGPLTTLAVVSSVDDVSRFDRPGQLSSYFGVCGSIRQSGQVRWMGAMTKRGNVHVRWLLSQSLQHLHRKDPKAAKRYRRLKRGKPVGVCRGAQMRWLTTIIWRLLINEEMYRVGGPESVRAA